MTENEAIDTLREFQTDKPILEMIYGKCHDEVLKMAISALTEIQKYREIGTVEECREAREKQVAKEPLNLEYVREDYSWMGECPCCHAYISENKKYCQICGQHMDWSKI